MCCAPTAALSTIVAEKTPVVFACRNNCCWKGLDPHLLVEAGFVPVHGLRDEAEVLAVSRQLAPCIVMVDPEFLERVEPEEFDCLVKLGSEVRVLVTVPELERATEEHYLKMGCMGVISGKASVLTLRRALCTIAAGEVWASRRAVSNTLRDLLSEAASGPLSRRELEILRLISAGRRNQDIADQLFISRETVRWHLRHLYAKLGVRDRAGAAEYAAKVFHRQIAARDLAVRPKVHREYATKVFHHQLA